MTTNHNYFAEFKVFDSPIAVNDKMNQYYRYFLQIMGILINYL